MVLGADGKLQERLTYVKLWQITADYGRLRQIMADFAILQCLTAFYIFQHASLCFNTF